MRPGRPAFDVTSLAPWQGRTLQEVELQGVEATREELVRRQIRSAVGEPLVLETVGGDVARLANLGTFAGVRAEADELEPGGGVRLSFVVSETYSILPMPALLYTEENGFSFGLGISAPNLAGRALKLSGKAFFGGTRQYWVNFDAPWLYTPRHHSFAASLAHRDRQDELRSFHESSYEVHPSVGRYLRDDRAQVSIGATYFNMESDVAGITLSSDSQDHLLGATVALSWDTRDDWGAPRRGWRNELELTRYWQLDGPAAFWRANLDLRRWVATGPRQKLLLGSLLTFQSGTLGEDVPQYLDYYVGGANTVRGYDSADRPVSGKSQLLGTVEYALELMKPREWEVAFLSVRLGLELAVFADAGLAWSRAGEFARDRTRAGLGAGLRLLVPGTEMVRLDVGWSGPQGVHLHLATGSKPAAQRQRLR
jgi:outer membrane protein assembly factor BamA